MSAAAAGFTAWLGTFVLLIAIQGPFVRSLAVAVAVGVVAATVASILARRGRAVRTRTIVGAAALGGVVVVGEVVLLVIAVMFYSH